MRKVGNAGILADRRGVILVKNVGETTKYFENSLTSRDSRLVPRSAGILLKRPLSILGHIGISSSLTEYYKKIFPRVSNIYCENIVTILLSN